MKTKKHNIVRDLIVYSIASFRDLIKTKGINGFISEMSLFSRWYRFRNSEEGTLHYQTPWLVFKSIDYLDSWLRPEMNAFEYGSGGSTLFFANRLEKVFSIEHDKEWFTITKTAIEAAKLNNIDYTLIEPEEDKDFISKNYMVTDDCISARKEFRQKHFSKYVKSINQFEDGFFDLVVVDGRARQSCIAFSLPKIKKSGVLLLDNAERDYYLLPNTELSDVEKWDRIDFIGHFPFAPASVLNKTSLFFKKY